MAILGGGDSNTIGRIHTAYTGGDFSILGIWNFSKHKNPGSQVDH